MAVDIKEMAEKVVTKIKADPNLLKSFDDDPVKTVEKVVGVDLPDDKIQPIITQVKTTLKNTLKTTLKEGNIADVAKDLTSKVTGLFGKKDN